MGDELLVVRDAERSARALDGEKCTLVSGVNDHEVTAILEECSRDVCTNVI